MTTPEGGGVQSAGDILREDLKHHTGIIEANYARAMNTLKWFGSCALIAATVFVGCFTYMYGNSIADVRRDAGAAADLAAKSAVDSYMKMERFIEIARKQMEIQTDVAKSELSLSFSMAMEEFRKKLDVMVGQAASDESRKILTSLVGEQVRKAGDTIEAILKRVNEPLNASMQVLQGKCLAMAEDIRAHDVRRSLDVVGLTEGLRRANERLDATDKRSLTSEWKLKNVKGPFSHSAGSFTVFAATNEHDIMLGPHNAESTNVIQRVDRGHKLEER